MAINTEMGAVSVSLKGDSKNLEKSLKRAQTSMQRFKDKARAAAAGAKKAFTAIGIAMAAVGAAAIKMADEIDKIGKAAKRSAVSAEFFQVLAEGAREAGVAVDTVPERISNLLDAIEKAKAGNKTRITAFENLNIDIEKLKQLNPEEQLIRISDAVRGIQDRSKLIGIFKNLGVDPKVIELLKTNFVDLNKEMRENGSILSNELVAKTEEGNDQLAKMKAKLFAVSAELLTRLMPAIILIGEILVASAKGWVFIFDSLEKSVENIVKAINKPKMLILKDEMIEINKEIFKTNTQLKQLKETRAAEFGGLVGSGAQQKKIAELEQQKLTLMSEQLNIADQLKALSVVAEKKKQLELEKAITDEQLKRGQAILNKKPPAAGDGKKGNGKGNNSKPPASGKNDLTDELSKQNVEVMSQAEIAKQSAIDASRTISSSLAQAAVDGNLSMQSMFRSIAKGFLQLQIQNAIINPLINSISFGSGTKPSPGIGLKSNYIAPTPTAAGGGHVNAGELVRVNELRNEYFRPDTSGVIEASKSVLSNGNNSKISVNINNNSSQPVQAKVQQSNDPAGAVISIILDDLTNGGDISSALATNYNMTKQV